MKKEQSYTTTMAALFKFQEELDNIEEILSDDYEALTLLADLRKKVQERLGY